MDLEFLKAFATGLNRYNNRLLLHCQKEPKPPNKVDLLKDAYRDTILKGKKRSEEQRSNQVSTCNFLTFTEVQGLDLSFPT